jgi:hypothetical protein
VEDDDSHAFLFTRVLQRYAPGPAVERVTDGIEALAYLRHEGRYLGRPKPDVVFLDLKLPRLDGLETLQRIKNDDSLQTIPVVMLTTSDAESDRATAYARRVNSYVVKPDDYEQFQQMVRDLGCYWGMWNCRPD